MKRSCLAGVAGAALWGAIAMAQPATAVPAATVDPDKGTGGSEAVYKSTSPSEELIGITVMGGGGVEGYTGQLAPQINPGPSWGVTVDWEPFAFLGLEAAYSGAANELKSSVVSGFEGSGADIMRNGVDGIVTAGMPMSIQSLRIKPYIMLGLGVSYYSVREALKPIGFQSDTVGQIPVGAGVKCRWGHVTADARFDYHILFSEDFATKVTQESIAGINSVGAGSYRGLIQVGATF